MDDLLKNIINRLASLEKTVQEHTHLLQKLENMPRATTQTSADKPTIQPPEPKQVKVAYKKPVSSWRALEINIGQYGAQIVGAITLIIGAALFTKFAFDHKLITPSARILIGLIAGTFLIIFSEWLRVRINKWTYASTTAGLCLLYISCYAAYWLGPEQACAWMQPLFSWWGSLIGVIVVSITACGLALWHREHFFAVFSALCSFIVPFFYHLNHDMAILYITAVATFFVIITSLLKSPFIDCITLLFLVGQSSYNNTPYTLIIAGALLILYHLRFYGITLFTKLQPTINAGINYTFFVISTTWSTFIILTWSHQQLFTNIRAINAYILSAFGTLLIVELLILFFVNCTQKNMLAVLSILAMAFYVSAVFSAWSNFMRISPLLFLGISCLITGYVGKQRLWRIMGMSILCLSFITLTQAIISAYDIAYTFWSFPTIVCLLLAMGFALAGWLSYYYRAQLSEEEKYMAPICAGAACASVYIWLYSPVFGFPSTLFALIAYVTILLIIGMRFIAVRLTGYAGVFLIIVTIITWLPKFWTFVSTNTELAQFITSYTYIYGPEAKYLDFVAFACIAACIILVMLFAYFGYLIKNKIEQTWMRNGAIIGLASSCVLLIHSLIHTYWIHVVSYSNELFATAYGILALSFIIGGLIARHVATRYTGFILLFMSMWHLLLIVLWLHSSIAQIIAFVSIGIGLLALSFIYQFFKKNIL